MKPTDTFIEEEAAVCNRSSRAIAWIVAIGYALICGLLLMRIFDF